MSRESIVLIGGGGHCRALIDVIEEDGEFDIAGILDSKENIGKKIGRYEVIGTDDDLPQMVVTHKNFVVSVGHVKSNAIRKKLYNQVKDLRGHFPTIVSPRAYVSKYVKFGEGVVVLHHAVINSTAFIGDNCIINTASVIEHDCQIGNHCHVAPSATINGGCIIFDDVLIGSSAVIIQGITIGKNSVVGAGSVVIRNVANDILVAGNPARKVKDL